jgi:hypothetical protein
VFVSFIMQTPVLPFDGKVTTLDADHHAQR